MREYKWIRRQRLLLAAAAVELEMLSGDHFIVEEYEFSLRLELSKVADLEALGMEAI